MQYETIILELMSRVQRLEEEVSELKDIVEDSNNQAEAQPKKNVKVTPEMTKKQNRHIIMFIWILKSLHKRFQSKQE